MPVPLLRSMPHLTASGSSSLSQRIMLYGGWDAQTQRIVPEGHAHAGQKIHAKTIEFGKSWDVTVTVNAVDESKHHIDLTTQLPFGITVYNHILCTPLKHGTTQVSFG